MNINNTEFFVNSFLLLIFCSCQPNYYGEKCELSSCPCVRGGICVGETDFNCLCPFGEIFFKFNLLNPVYK